MCLLLVLLLELPHSLFAGLLLRHALVVLLLLLRQFLVFLLLLRGELLLLLQVFLVQLEVSRVWRSGECMRRKVLGMNWNGVLGMRDRRVGAWLDRCTLLRSMIGRACLFGRYDSAAFECCRCLSRCDRGLALVHRSSQLRISASVLDMLGLNR